MEKVSLKLAQQEIKKPRRARLSNAWWVIWVGCERLYGLYITKSEVPRHHPQRLIKAVLMSKAPPNSISELKALAKHYTIQEDSSRKVERHLRKSEVAMLLKPRIGLIFKGVISGVNQKGM